jgi:hypothetical protein
MKKQKSIEKTNPDKTRQLSIEQMKAIELLAQGQSVNTVAQSVGVSSQTIYDWRHDPLFIAELNHQRSRLWSEAQERLRSLANEAIDVLEDQLASDGPKVALSAARYVMQGTKLLGDTNLNLPTGPTTPEGVLMERLRIEARAELKAQAGPGDFMFGLDDQVERLARQRLKGALNEAGL